nr:LLM class flavin-dependent oxidoreductase [Kibdelosporangium sp. MJ126-NF4]CEL20956.1 Alkanesulfonate monooxygenase [Kibdelosporangium sp. MJ126-NF4]CTQ95530.1 Alkanesulfonate monooxygenase (EC 1.14.14.5) [Kibdelosporangium sp. MJ126-NF4]
MRFLWSLSSVGDSLRRSRSLTSLSGVPDMAAHVAFCERAEACGIESVLMAFGFTRPDPIVYSAMLGARTERMRFLVAVRSGISSPTYFTQQINTLSAVTGGRVDINIVAGRAPDELRYYGDFLTHDERYRRTDEFWTICHALWRRDGPVTFEGTHYRVEGARLSTAFYGGRPEIYLGGSSEQAMALAIRHADCLLTLPDAPQRMRPRIQPVLDSGTEVGLLVTLICRPTHAEAVEAAYAVVESAGEQAREVHGQLRGGSDSVGYKSTYDLAAQGSAWVTPYLWTGAVPYLGPPGISLVGSPAEIVEALCQYQSVGVTRFLFMGHPDLEEMTFFGSEVLPMLRAGVG